MSNEFMRRPIAKAAEPSTDAGNDKHRYSRVQHTRTEILEQATVLEKTGSIITSDLKKVIARLDEKTITRICLLGCGDSWFVGIGTRHALESLLSIPCEPMQALDFALYYADTVTPDTLVIGLSSGGNTPAVMDGLRKARSKGGVTIGISNTRESPILTEFDAGIYIPATRKGWPTQASTSAMIALIQLGICLNEKWSFGQQEQTQPLLEELSQLPEIVKDIISKNDQVIHEIAQELVRKNYFMFTGAGPHYAAAAFGAAKIKELCPSHAVAMPLEEFHHYRTLKPNDILFLVAPDGQSHKRALDTVEVGIYDGGRVIALVSEGDEAISKVATRTITLPKGDERLAPIIFSIPLQLFAYHLAMAKFEQNLGYPDSFGEG